jgi:hypothetical protein
MRGNQRIVRLAATIVGALIVLLSLASSAAAALPSIEAESASNITTTSATLEAEVNLHKAPAGVYYQFQVVSDPSEYATEILCPPTLQPGYSGCVGPTGTGALPIGFLSGATVPPGSTSHASLDLASAGRTLESGATYHYRVLVAPAVQAEDTIQWEEPTVFGTDQTFTTPPTDSPSPNDSTSVLPFNAPRPGGFARASLRSASTSTSHPRHRWHLRHHRGGRRHKRRPRRHGRRHPRHRIELYSARRVGRP